ncbi:carbohydrate esterase family 15 protein, partial [Zopfia rhizophila CBS 207.26]
TTDITKLPDPFTLLNGEKLSSKAEWLCRRKEITSLFEKWLLGPKPPAPSFQNASISNTIMTIQIEESNRKTNFAVKINLPQGQGEGPFPAIIAYSAASIPLNNTSIATIVYYNDQIASSSRGRGKFYDIYGSDHKAGALIAWAWGVSRIIDALHDLGPALTNIDPHRIGLTGCSRNGRGVYVAGAFDERIVLTIPQEAGPGGPACWRQYDSSRCTGICIPEQPEPGAEFSTWYTRDFPSNVNMKFSRLPFDQHMLATLVAPRGLLVLDNDIDWLNPVGSTTCSLAGRKVYEALGVKTNMGFSMVGGHQHCQFPAKEQDGLMGFLDRFLMGRGGGVDIWTSKANVDISRWVDW